ncbi:MAG: hypothetical protein EA396_09160 [Anaerolineaceae bacterium]|nr:MAG: hypothetical protein EA396_09160 [Anaerolineaceae bacterium]
MAKSKKKQTSKQTPKTTTSKQAAKRAKERAAGGTPDADDAEAKAVKSGGGERERAKQRAAELKRKQRKRRLTNMSIIGAVIAVLFVTVIFFVNQPADAPLPDGVMERYAALPQQVNDSGFFVLGNPAAPVNVVEYSSFTCPACLDFYETAMDQIIEYAEQGIISYTFIPRFVGSFQNPEGAARAAYCAGEQGMFYEMHDTLFSWQNTFGNTAFTQNRMASGAANLGLNTGDFRSCLSSGAANRHVNNANNEANNRGFIGAPITTVNGVQVNTTLPDLRQQVISALGSQQPRPPAAIDETLPPELQPTTPDDTGDEAEDDTALGAPVPLGLSERYDDIAQTQDGLSFVLGDPDAPVIVEEFGSYSCPLCAEWYAESADVLLEHIREGRVALVYFAHFTGSISAEHLESATKAAFCAGQQDAFFSYSGMLYSWQSQFNDDSFLRGRLIAGADNLGLDVEAFTECLDSDEANAFIEDSMQNVNDRDVTGTPTLFVNGEELSEITVEALEAAIASGADEDEPEEEEEEESDDE